MQNKKMAVQNFILWPQENNTSHFTMTESKNSMQYFYKFSNIKL